MIVFKSMLGSRGLGAAGKKQPSRVCAPEIKARRGHLDSIERGKGGTFAPTGGRGSQGGKYGKDDGDDEDKKKPGKGKDKVGSVPWLSRTEQMHKPVPKKPKKPVYGGKKPAGPSGESR